MPRRRSRLAAADMVVHAVEDDVDAASVAVGDQSLEQGQFLGRRVQIGHIVVFDREVLDRIIAPAITGV